VRQSELKKQADDCAAKIANAVENVEYFEEPYKHIAIDNFLDPALAQRCLEGFPALTDTDWQHANDKDIEIKYRTMWQSEFDIPENIIDAVRIMNSAPFLKAMAAKLGIKKILPDPYYAGGGLNVTMRGGLLDVHVDGNYHDATGLNRRINAILYLNPDWQPDWGGEFGVYDNTGQECVKRIPPLHNRLVIFDTHDFSFHGLPDPINFPEGEQRRSIILYYYTKEARPSSQIAVEDPHSALWVKRGLTDKRGSKTRDFT
jgi:Rps23 Pro-64 3,4-dihydroxylase Tpa1-like proline 4-hydroxylase